MLLRLSLPFALLMLSCSHAQVASPPPTKPIAIVSPTTNVEPTPVPTPPQPIRSIDFNNVRFPHYPEYTDRGKRYVTLKRGDGGPALLNYGDVTGDGIEEAMMMLGIETRGTAIPEIVYIFTLENRRPKLLWSFETGDRADGGFRNAYADHGELVVELFGRDRVIGTQLNRDDDEGGGLCCPRSFTRARYKWDGTKFRLSGKTEVLANPSGGAGPVMPEYSGPSK